MVESSNAISPDDDPNSELNVLRREVRHLQGSVRDAGLQIASQQDEIIELRKTLAAAEADVEEGLMREEALRNQLEAHGMKKDQIERTMEAAERLIESLKDIVKENVEPNDELDDDEFFQFGVPGATASSWPRIRDERPIHAMGDKLDRVLDKIEEPQESQVSPRSPHTEEFNNEKSTAPSAGASATGPPTKSALTAIQNTSSTADRILNQQYNDSNPTMTTDVYPDEIGNTEEEQKSQRSGLDNVTSMIASLQLPSVPAKSSSGVSMKEEKKPEKSGLDDVTSMIASLQLPPVTAPKAAEISSDNSTKTEKMPEKPGLDNVTSMIASLQLPPVVTQKASKTSVGKSEEKKTLRRESKPATLQKPESSTKYVSENQRMERKVGASSPRAKENSPPVSPTQPKSPVPQHSEFHDNEHNSFRKQVGGLLKSAFLPGSSIRENHSYAVRSAGVEPGQTLPAEVANFAKAEETSSAGSIVLPSVLSNCIYDAHGGEIYALAASSEEAWVVSGGDDKTVRVYDQNGAVFSSFAENTKAVTALAVEPDLGDIGLRIHVGGSDGSVRIFKKSERKRLRWKLSTVVPAHTQAVRRILTTSSAGMNGAQGLLLTCSTDRAIRLIDVDHEKRPFSVSAPSAALDISMFTGSDHRLIASGHKDGGVRLYSNRDADPLVSGAKVHTKGVISLSCLEDGHSIVSLGRDNVIRLSDIRMGIAIVREMDKGVNCVSDWHRITTRGRYVACGSGKQNVHVWNVDTGKVVKRLSSQVVDPNADVLDMVARKLRSPGCVMVPLWKASGQFVGAHRFRQVSFWS